MADFLQIVWSVSPRVTGRVWYISKSMKQAKLLFIFRAKEIWLNDGIYPFHVNSEKTDFQTIGHTLK